VALVGADGIWSAVRHHLFPEARPQFSGLIAWRGTLEATELPREYTSRRVQLWMDRTPIWWPIRSRAGARSTWSRWCRELEPAGLERARRCRRNQERIRSLAVAGRRA